MDPIPDSDTAVAASSADVPGELAPAGLLFVDDEKNILGSLRRLFRPEGYRLFMANSGAEGLEILARESIDLVISDMRMPEMDGAQFLAQVATRWPGVVRFLLTGYADLSSTVDAINKGKIYGYFSKPWEDNEIKLAVRHALEQKRLIEEKRRLEELTREQNAELRDLNENLEARVKARTEEIRQANMFLELAYRQIKESYFDAIPIFARLIELREGEHRGHGRRVADDARAIAEALKLDEAEIQQIYFAGLLHDIGKIGLSDEITQTPYARLDKQQRGQFEQHAVDGQAVLMALEPLHPAADIIRHHHERYDGKGYPDGMAGIGISVGARIVAVASDYDDLLTGMLLGEQLDEKEAREFLSKNRERRYHRNIVDSYLAILEQRAGTQREGVELRLTSEDLRPGMVLTQDLANHQGMSLLTRGHRLTAELIDKIRSLEEDTNNHFILHVLA